MNTTTLRSVIAPESVSQASSLLLSAMSALPHERTGGGSGTSIFSPMTYEGHLSVSYASHHHDLLRPGSLGGGGNISLLSLGVDPSDDVKKYLDTSSSSSPLRDEEGISCPPYRCTKCNFVELSSLESFRAHLKESSHWNHSLEEDDIEDDVEEDECEGDLEEDLLEEEESKSASSKPGSKALKSLKCKQCNYVGISKEDFWRHTRGHIKPEKLLSCPQCPFVTEYKHHLEYHLRNHFGSKPFKCRNCSYSCYRCRDCSYATKYCHSLKLHLRKYKHKPDVVLNSDGSVNPLPVIDVYGTRRGPKTKKDDTGNPVIPPFVMAQMAAQKSQSSENKQPSPVAAVSPFNANEESIQEDEDDTEDEAEVITLKCELCGFQSQSREIFENHMNYHSRRRKRQDRMPNHSPHLEQPQEKESPARAYIEYFRNLAPFFLQNNDSLRSLLMQKGSGFLKGWVYNTPGIKANVSPGYVWENSHVCSFCEVAFKDPIMHTIHMGYHGFSNPFKCNMCGEEAGDKLSFFLHLARKSHV
ncbi:HB [Lepeophtheirus salmonis]|uniref:HB n=1 Tax=Lepeophtheirus salmonis TaxID=72036 RepID=A0A7R8CUI7_LEPSM|nr:HB [Lepeophtheirus salmonis]CAF2885487.1 HB [Lepeophtheirus salmonis]